MKHLIIWLTLIVYSVAVYGNTYKRYDVRSGLSGNCVRSIVQDSIGYMWFATQDGLSRFNGTGFTNYGHSSGNDEYGYINVISICRHLNNRNIWVADVKTLYLFDTWQEKFTPFDKKTAEGAHVNSVFCMTYDNAGQLWIGTAGGLFVYNEAENLLKSYRHNSNNPRSL
ncbi:MAG: hybrid sensor histidine kinase/response regulator, partial [Dysgonamonadaceae bacterium]|nr:hybrid sensor histidine kinase/response regulator [Dysgonamonadaceae bacterium]